MNQWRLIGLAGLRREFGGLVDYMVHRITTNHNDTRDFRLEHDGVHVRGYVRWFSGAVYLFVARESLRV